VANWPPRIRQWSRAAPVAALRDRLWRALRADGWLRNGHLVEVLPNTLNASVGGVGGAELLARATAITARLDAAHDPYRHQNLVYSGAGHAVGSAVPYVPASPPVVSSRYGNLDLGGSRPVNARALADAWPRLLAFLAAAGTEVAGAPAAAGS
jgi:dienelactone hydrolase